MEIIFEDEMTLERLLIAFHSNSLPAEIIEVYPAEPAPNLARDAYLKVDYPDCVSVIIWIDTRAHCLRMRIVIYKHGEIVQTKTSNWSEWADGLNQQSECFGTLSAENVLGVTIEYRLPYQVGILEQTVLLSAEQLVRGASLAKASTPRTLRNK